MLFDSRRVTQSFSYFLVPMFLFQLELGLLTFYLAYLGSNYDTFSYLFLFQSFYFCKDEKLLIFPVIFVFEVFSSFSSFIPSGNPLLKLFIPILWRFFILQFIPDKLSLKELVLSLSRYSPPFLTT